MINIDKITTKDKKKTQCLNINVLDAIMASPFGRNQFGLFHGLI